MVSIVNLLEKIVDPLFLAISKDASLAFQKLHKEDYSKPGSKSSASSNSPFVIDLSTRLKWVHRELISVSIFK